MKKAMSFKLLFMLKEIVTEFTFRIWAKMMQLA